MNWNFINYDTWKATKIEVILFAAFLLFCKTELLFFHLRAIFVTIYFVVDLDIVVVFQRDFSITLILQFSHREHDLLLLTTTEYCCCFPTSSWGLRPSIGPSICLSDWLAGFKLCQTFKKRSLPYFSV